MNSFVGLFLGYFFFISFSFSSEALSGPLLGGKIPTPKELQKDVQFWEKIFSVYKAKDCVIHDSKHLDVVYLVTRLPSRRRSASRKMRRKIGEVTRLLRRLGAGRRPRARWETRIISRIPSKYRNRSFYRQAARRVRCQRGVKEQFASSQVRSQKYLKMIRKIFKKKNIPEDLVYLPHLESGFNNRARSKVGARGLWQIMPRSASGFLKVNRRRDERVHPLKATRFAAKQLSENYRKIGSWPLAITAYNYGVNGVVRAVRKFGTKKYMVIHRRHKTRIFRFAARNFFPSFLAVRNLAKRYEHRARYTSRQSSNFKIARKAF